MKTQTNLQQGAGLSRQQQCFEPPRVQHQSLGRAGLCSKVVIASGHPNTSLTECAVGVLPMPSSGSGGPQVSRQRGEHASCLHSPGSQCVSLEIKCRLCFINAVVCDADRTEVCGNVARGWNRLDRTIQQRETRRMPTQAEACRYCTTSRK